MPRESTMGDDVVAFREDQLVLVAQRVGKRSDEIEQPVTTGFDVSAVLNVLIRPESGGRCVVTLVKERVEGHQDQCFVLSGCRVCHGSSSA